MSGIRRIKNRKITVGTDLDFVVYLFCSVRISE